jgi:hypothetical protein
MNTLLKLYNPSNPAPLYERGFADPNMLRYYVLVHDVRSGKQSE